MKQGALIFDKESGRYNIRFGLNAVMDALGHHDNSTAVKYLSFDDERMMECPLPLSGIAVEGGAL